MNMLPHLVLRGVLSVGQIASVGAVQPESSETDRQTDLSERLQALLDTQEYAEARALLQEAWESTGNPDYLFMRGGVEQLAGDCRAANETFSAYIQHADDEAAMEAARDRIQPCSPEPDAPVVTMEAPEPPPSPALQTPPPGPPKPWYTDVAGGVLMGAGVGVLAAGASVYGHGWTLARRANDAEYLDDYGGTIGRAQRFNRIGIAVLSTAAALVVAGSIRYAVVHRRNRGR